MRGVLTELLSLAGVATATSLACNFYAVLANRIAPWWRFDPTVIGLVSFSVLFLTGMFVVYVAVRRLVELMKGEQLYWITQLLGMIVGAARGLWWIGLALLVALSLQVPYLNESIKERSIGGPHVVRVTYPVLVWVADRYPGSMSRTNLIPSTKLRLPRLPEELRLEEHEKPTRPRKRSR